MQVLSKDLTSAQQHYDVGASDLQTLDPVNKIAKFADDTMPCLITGSA